jgi:hypothetical protein
MELNDEYRELDFEVQIIACGLLLGMTRVHKHAAAQSHASLLSFSSSRNIALEVGVI